MKTYSPLLLVLFLLLSIPLQAQSTFACPDGINILPESSCYEACIPCDGFDNSLISDNYNTNPWIVSPPPPGFCAQSLDNLSYLPFVAGANYIAFEFIAYNCLIGQGLQVGIFGSENCENWIQQSICYDQVIPGQPYILEAFNLIEGHIYYFVIDGFSGDLCEFQIDVLVGSTTALPIEGTPVINGPTQVCSGGTEIYTVEGVQGASEYIWDFEGSQFVAGSTIDISFPTENSYELCVTPYSPCFGEGTTTCQIIFANSLSTVFINETLCSEEFPYQDQGQVFTSPGVYTYWTTTANGCTQEVVLTLEQYPDPPLTIIDTAICEGELLVIAGVDYNAPGNYFISLSNVNGCDSTVQLDLFVLQPMDTINAQICEGATYMIGSSSYDMAGSYIDTIQGASGCQSIIYLDLIVVPSSFTSLFESICPGDTLQTATGIYTLPGNYSETYTGLQGCDSIVDISLNWLPTYQDTIQESICEGDTLLWNNITYTEMGTYEQVLTTTNGCDSTVTLLLAVISSDTTYLDVTICNGEAFVFGDTTLTESGIYESVFTSTMTLCDSIVRLTLEVLPLNLVTIDVEICEGDDLVIGGTTIDQPGAYQFILLDQYLCDSIIEVIVTVIPTSYTDMQAEICEGDSFEVGGNAYTEPGVYTETLISVLGCDSIVNLALSVLPINEPTQIDTTLCFGKVFEIGPYTFTDTVDNLLQFTGENGCDSLVHLQLSYYDEIVVESVDIEADLIGGIPDGSISLTLAGGTAPYRYLWSNGQVSNGIDLLIAGEYFLIVTDARGCQEGFYFTVPFDPGILPEDMLIRTGSSTIKVSPNPFTTEIEVEVIGQDQELPVQLRLFNMSGQLIWEERREEARFFINPELAAGLYWLVAFQEGEMIGVERILKVE